MSINEAAGDLCVNNLSLLADRAKLFDMAQDVVREDRCYKFAHGKSRSKKVTTSSQMEQPKREKIDSEERNQRMETLSERIKDINKHIVLKERRIEQAQGIQNYKLCDQLMEEVDSLKSSRGELESSLRTLQRKDKRSVRYFASKNVPRPDTSISEASNEADDVAATPSPSTESEPFL